MKKLFSIAFLLAFLLPIGSMGQEIESNHPELDWYTIRTDHFRVHYHSGTERTARLVAKIAEEIYGPVTQLYGFQPDGLSHFIIRDHDDNSNGAAYYYDNKIEIWAPQMTFILRGTHNWLRNVVAHEFSHMISLGASRKATRRMPAVYLQGFGYEPEKRPDVLYGYPNRLASYPLPMTIVPMWLAEGMAQFQTIGLDYDQWDSHRDMLIRTAVVAGKPLSFTEMGVFGKNSLGNERTYNAGYALTRYLVLKWGEGALKRLTEQLAKPWTFTVDGALKQVTGLSSAELHAQWQQELTAYYGDRLAQITPHRVEGRVVTPKGIGNTYAQWAPDGKRLAFCGHRSESYLTLTHLMIYDVAGQKSKIIKTGVNSQLSWSPDGGKIVYSRSERGKHGSHYQDLYVYDLAGKKEKQLTRNLRAFDPDWSPSGDRIICVTQKDGSDNLTLVLPDGSSRPLTHFKQGESLSSPRWSADGRSIVLSKGRNHGRDLLLYHPESDTWTTLISGQGDARDPVFSPDGSRIYFSWDKTGIFNIYSMTPQATEQTQWTNVVGGAFMPSVTREGRLAFANFHYQGYRIADLEQPAAIDPDQAVYRSSERDLGLAPETFAVRQDSSLENIRRYDDHSVPDMPSEPYEMTYSRISFLPRAMLDYGTLKLGSYFYAADVLNRYSLFGGLTLNRQMDLDAFAIFEMKRWAPTLFLELYGFTRHVTRDIEVIEDYPEKASVDIGFNILEADLGAYYGLSDHSSIRLAFVHGRYTSQIKDFLFNNQQWVSPQNTYYIGNHFTMTWTHTGVLPGPSASINPFAGRKIEVKYSREFNRFFDDFATNNDYGTLQEVYARYNYHRLEMDWHEYWPMPWSSRHTLTLNLKGGWVDRPVDSFFNFFAGGLPGLRGYPYYSIEGRKMLIGRFTYRLPLLSLWQKKFFHLTSDRIYLAAFMDYGNAFNQDRVDLTAFKRDVGVNLRCSMFSFYGFPTALSLEAAYGLDAVVNQELRYGKEWRYYATLLFDFID